MARWLGCDSSAEQQELWVEQEEGDVEADEEERSARDVQRGDGCGMDDVSPLPCSLRPILIHRLSRTPHSRRGRVRCEFWNLVKHITPTATQCGVYEDVFSTTQPFGLRSTVMVTANRERSNSPPLLSPVVEQKRRTHRTVSGGDKARRRTDDT